MKQTSESLGAEISGAADRSIQATTHALATTRELASQAMERGGDKLRDARKGLREASAATRRQLGQYAERTTRYVSERPVTSALIAAVVGAAVAALAVAVLRNKGRQS